LHGTSTELNDRIETRAIKLAFGEAATRIPMSATKSMVGHPQGASGAAGLTAAPGGRGGGVLCPAVEPGEPAPGWGLDYVPQRARLSSIRNALCNCIGFGSKNSALVVKKFEV